MAAPAPGVAVPPAPAEKIPGLFTAAAEKAAAPAPAPAPAPIPEPVAPAAEGGEEEDPFDKIFSIFNHK